MTATEAKANSIEIAVRDGKRIAKPDPSCPFAVVGLTVAYHHKPVLWNVSFTAPEGRLVGVVGPNGAGKSTFIKASLGLIPQIAGEIAVFGKPVPKMRQRVAYVPQRSTVDWDFPANVLDVVTMGLYGKIGWFRWPRRRHRDEALECLAKVGMADFAERQIGQLSGGQQQRVFLARALAQQAAVYLMDEPFAGVDAATEVSVINVLKSLIKAGKTVIVVHHDLETVTTYFDHVLILNGRAVAAGPVRDAFTEENLQKAYGGRLANPQLNALGAARARA